jgi:butyryl-CoA dehydrogenase
MDFSLTPEQRLIRDTAKKIAREVILPNVERYDRERAVPWEAIKALGELGMMAPIVPEEYGGPGLDYVTYALIGEQLSWADPGTATVVGAHCSLGTAPILMYGTEEQKKKYLPKLASGEWIGAFALTEPNAGSDASNILVKAEDKGDHWLINGQKQWTTNGDIAKVVILFARIGGSSGLTGITPFIIETDMEGFSTGAIEKTMGIHASHQVVTLYDNIKLPKENVLGGPRNVGRGFQVAMGTLDGGRIGIASSGVGLSTRALEEAVKYTQERVQFGQPISENQGIQFKIADMTMKVNAARLLTYYAAWLKDRGVKMVREAAMAKCFAADVAMEVTIEAIQCFGGYGYSMEYPVEKLARDAKIHQIYEGTNEIQRMLIAREVYKRGVFAPFEEIEQMVS